jgi:hypothetical protein
MDMNAKLPATGRLLLVVLGLVCGAAAWGGDRAAATYPVERPARPAGAPPPDREGRYVIRHDRPRQFIWGLGFEIQSDSIASGNQGLPESTTSAPHDLVPSERERLYREMLSGFRYCRLAGGLYWRGLTGDGKNLVGRWPEQMDELREMVEKSGIEGLSLEYWSPAPYWKANRQYVGGDGSPNVLRCFGPEFDADPEYRGDVDRFLDDFAEALVRDVQYLKAHGLPVVFWGLQNEPHVDTRYSSCRYTPLQYHRALKATAARIRLYDPRIVIIADTHMGQASARPVREDPEALALVDAWVWHQIGHDSDTVIDRRERYLADRHGRPVFQNEYEYLSGPASPARCLNTVQNLMNWLALVDSPTWFWIHALKPTYNAEASGYALGFWRPHDDEKTADLEKGHWRFNDHNWIAMAGFLRYMPWDSRRYEVAEDRLRPDNRILAFKTPEGKLAVVVTNRSGVPFTFRIDAGIEGALGGYRYTPDEAGPEYRGVALGARRGPSIAVTVPDMAFEFWVEQ